jgi:hypothetical protein
MQLLLEGGVTVVMRTSEYNELGARDRVAVHVSPEAITFLTG